ncbi:16978_t:CDS:2, partial [Acaulospora colombiana]
TREAATVVPIEDLIASAYANKKPRKSRADQFDHIRGLGKMHQSVAPKSVKSSKSKRVKFPHEEDQDSDWESIGEDGTEAWEYNSDYRDAAGSSSGGGGASVTTPSTASASGRGEEDLVLSLSMGRSLQKVSQVRRQMTCHEARPKPTETSLVRTAGNRAPMTKAKYRAVVIQGGRSPVEQ